jgi:NDP-sugar pyrophosphorylase family protein
LPHIKTDTALVANGDCFFEADLSQMYAWHDNRRAPATILLTSVDDVSRFGSVETDPSGAVRAFREKGGEGAGWINAGVYLITRAMLEKIPKGRPVSIEKEVFPSWVDKGLCAWRGEGDFLDIGTAESYAQAAAFVSG